MVDGAPYSVGFKNPRCGLPAAASSEFRRLRAVLGFTVSSAISGLFGNRMRRWFGDMGGTKSDDVVYIMSSQAKQHTQFAHQKPKLAHQTNHFLLEPLT
jgi:hypothetical protein